MVSLVLAAVVATMPLEGDVISDGGDYAIVEFEVPEGIVEIHVAHSDGSEADILDWGLWGPSGFRGWGGGLSDDAIAGVEESSRGYLTGPIEAGTWQVVIGKALIKSESVHYDIVVTLHDEPTLLEPRPRSPSEAGDLAGESRWYAGDLHVHSRESGDASATFEDISTLARDRGLDFVVLSDHNTVSQHPLATAFQDGVDDVLFVRGCEITTYAGHGNGLGISSYVDHRVGYESRSAAGIIDDVAAQGGAFVVNHPALALGDACIGCAWTHEDTPWDEVAALEIQTGPYSIWPVFGRTVMGMWDDLFADGYRVTAVGGSDDHRAGMGEGATDSPIGSPTTVVFSESLSEADLIEGIRQGRVVVKLRGPDDPMVELFAEDEDGARGMIGDTIAASTAILEVRVTGGDGTSVALFKNGEFDESVDVVGDDFTHRFEREVSAAGDRYRAHIRDGNDVVITNHVFVDYVEGEPMPDDDGDGCGCATGSGAGGAGVALLALALLGGRRRRRD